MRIRNFFFKWSEMESANPLPRVLVVGSGGVGAMAAFALSQAKKSSVTLVVRSDYGKIKDHGYTIESVVHGTLEGWRPEHVCPSVTAAAETGIFDFVVVTTKNIPDGQATCEDIVRPAVTCGHTTLVLIQNGIGIEEPMFDAFPGCAVLSGVLLIGLAYKDGVVKHLHKDRLYLAPFDHEEINGMAQTELFAKIYQNSDPLLNTVIVELSARRSRWEKLVNNAVFNPVTALTGLDINRCQINGANETVFSPAMDEVIAIAASDGVEIDPSAKSRFLHVADGSFFASSMLVDLRKGQLVEVEVIVGNVLRIAQRNNVLAPVLATLYLLLRMVQFRTKESLGMIHMNEKDYVGHSSDDYPAIFAALNNKHS